MVQLRNPDMSTRVLPADLAEQDTVANGTQDRDSIVSELERRIKLETLIATISSRIAFADLDALDAEVRTSLGEVARFIGCDRALMYRFTTDLSAAVLSCDWQDGPESASSAIAEIHRDVAPQVLDFFLARKTLNSPRPETLPPGFKQLNELPGVERVQSRISVPVVQGTVATGILCFHSIAIERNWRDEDHRLLGLLGEIIGSALARAAAASALKDAKEAAEHASSAKSEFLARMSHELRTPLNGILGHAQLLRQRSLSPDVSHSVAAIERCGDHLTKLIGDLLDLSRIETDHVELDVGCVYVEDFMRELADELQIRATKQGLGYGYKTHRDCPSIIQADARKLRQVLLNLIDNAVKFTTSGYVRLSVTSTQPRDGAACVRFEVADSGCGIAPDQVERIFEPFYQAGEPTSRPPGSGLGLAISRRLIELMGGTISVDPAQGVGSVFVVELEVPIATVDDPADLPVDVRPCGYRGRRRAALVVDDNVDNRDVLCELLRSVGFEVSEVHDGVEALAAVAKHEPDVIFMDLVLPTMDGFEATRQIRTTLGNGHPCIIAVSADAFPETRRKAIDAGCNAFIAKPLQFDNVLGVVADHLGLKWQHAGSGSASAGPLREDPGYRR